MGGASSTRGTNKVGPEADVVDLEHPETPFLGTTPFPKCEKLETHCSWTSTRSHDSHPAHVSPQPFLRVMASSLLLSSALSSPPFLSLKPHLLRPPGFASSFPNLRKSFHQVKSLNSVWFPKKHREISTTVWLSWSDGSFKGKKKA